MGKRSRLHREAVIAGDVAPFRQGTDERVVVTLKPPVRGSGQGPIRCACGAAAVAIVAGRALCRKHLQGLLKKVEERTSDAQASKKDS